MESIDFSYVYFSGKAKDGKSKPSSIHALKIKEIERLTAVNNTDHSCEPFCSQL